MSILTNFSRFATTFVGVMTILLAIFVNELRLQHAEIKNVSLIINDTVSLYLDGYELHRKITKLNIEDEKITKLVDDIDRYSLSVADTFSRVRLVLNTQFSDGIALLLPVYKNLENVEEGIRELNRLQKHRLKNPNSSYKEQLVYILRRDEIEHKIVSTITILRYDVQYLISDNIEFWEFYSIFLLFIYFTCWFLISLVIYLVYKWYVNPINKLYVNLKKGIYDCDAEFKIKEISYLHKNIVEFNNNIKSTQAEIINQSEKRYRLMSTFAHESRTLLGILTGNISLLDDHNKEKEMKFIKDIALDLTKLVNQFLLFSRFKDSEVSNNSSYVDIYSLLRKKCESYSFLAKKNNEQLKLYGCGHIPTYIKIDNDKLKNIIDNLLSNAFKYSIGNGVSVELSSDDNCVSISIRDHGRGIPQDKISQMFHPYEQINKFKDIGSGLGLSIVHELVEQLNCELAIESKVGVGSVFKVMFKKELGSEWLSPSNEFKSESASCKNSIKEIGFIDHIRDNYLVNYAYENLDDTLKGNFSELTVLVAEDFILNQKLIKNIFLQFDLHVDFASDGIEAVKMVSDKEYDVLFMDIKMPNKDGIQAAKDIRYSLKKNIHIFALTAAYDFENNFDENNQLFDGFLGKPISQTDLISALEKVKLARNIH